MRLTLTDDSFTVTARGELVAVRPVYVSASGRTFSVSAGPGSEMEVHLDCATQVIDSGTLAPRPTHTVVVRELDERMET